MLDYKLLEAFYYVITEGGFEKASSTLCITQSAVSQRVKLLEEQSGQVLLIRSNPPKATPAGELYLNHYLNVSHLEDGLQHKKSGNNNQLKLGLNADSLATWFMPLAMELLPENMLLDLMVNDQERTIDFLASGEVVAAITTWDRAVQGCSMTKLGTMQYTLLATPKFRERWFKGGITVESVTKAPAVLYDKNDNLHDLHLKRILGSIPNYPKHFIPSTEQFFNLIAGGKGYGLLPDLQGMDALNSGKLVDLSPNYKEKLELFLHNWNYISAPVRVFLDKLISHISQTVI